MNKTKNCLFCRSEIPIDAKKCVKCNERVDTFRYFGITNTTLSLLIAFFAVLTTSIPVIYDNLILKKDSNISLRYITHNGDNIILWATNRGKYPGYIGSLTINFSNNNNNFTWHSGEQKHVDLHIVDYETGIQIENNGAKLLKYRLSLGDFLKDFDQNRFKSFASAFQSGGCEMYVSVVSFRGVNNNRQLPMQCNEAIRFINENTLKLKL